MGGHRFGEKWKQYEMLHEMINVNKRINPAPKRELLNIFGGNLKIDEFRGDTEWKLVYPPMVSLKLQMDDTPVQKSSTLDNPLLKTENTKLNLDIITFDNI